METLPEQRFYPEDYTCENCGQSVDELNVCTCVKWCVICGKDYYDLEDALNCCVEKEALK